MLLLRLFSANVPRHLQDIPRKVSRIPITPGTFSLQKKTDISLSILASWEISVFVLPSVLSPERGKEENEKSKRFKPAHEHG